MKIRIKQLLNIQRRYLRSANLERDFRDPSALDGYVVTRHVEESVIRINSGLSRKSGQRAWRITGGYGTGKSSFALLLSQLYARREAEIPSQLRRVLDEPISQIKRSGFRFLPILVTGSREPLGLSLIKAIRRTLADSAIINGFTNRRLKFESFRRASDLLARTDKTVTDAEVLELVTCVHNELVSEKVAEGIFIVLDELGKFLEYSALHPSSQDVYLLQQLAEVAARSAGDAPLFLVGLLHQGFSAYADLLSPSAQKEWEKVAGRFEELFFDQPLEQLTQLISSALGVKKDEAGFPRGIDARARSAMRDTVDLGWYGAGAPVTALTDLASSLYPLHPTVVPVIVKLFGKWGQNERSLFSFLLSGEPFGLQAFSEQEPSNDRFYRLHNLYDYAAANFGHRLGTQGFRSNWNHIDSLVRSFPSRNEDELQVLKTVGLLNLLNSPQCIPTDVALNLAVSPMIGDGNRVLHILEHLHKDRKILYLRGRSGGYCLWSHTSVDLDSAYDEAGRALLGSRRVASRIKTFLDARPIVARRHYIQTGNLRCFDVVYCDLPELANVAASATDGIDGRIVIPLCETAEEISAATRFAKSLSDRPTILIGVSEPLTSLEGLVQEVERWTWVERNTPELKDDKLAAEVVARRLALAIQTLEKQIQHYVGVRLSSRRDEMPVKWYHEGRQLIVKNGCDFLSRISDLCDDVYCKSPKVHNELVNRRSISASASLARTKLIERIFRNSEEELLGMDKDKKPPEMAIYMSLLQGAKIHVKRQGRWRIVAPRIDDLDADPCRLGPALEEIENTLQAAGEAKVAIPDVFSKLRSRPYGVKDGLLPLVLAIYLRANWHRIALYEDGTYLHDIGGMEFTKLTKEPECFALQSCSVTGVRSEVFSKLMLTLGIPAIDRSAPDLLDVVRPLMKFVAQLPDYARKTKSVSATAVAVRAALLSGREPAPLLFRELPKACGLSPFSSESAGREQVETFAEAVKTCIQQLQTAYDRLLDRIEASLQEAFGSQSPLKVLRPNLAQRCNILKEHVTDPSMKAFLFRLSDSVLPRNQWLESLASLLVKKPAEHWGDNEETEFHHQLTIFAQRMSRMEALVFTNHKQNIANTCRLAMTRPDGTEVLHVFEWDDADGKKTAELERDIREMLRKHSNIGIAAAARVIWSALKH